VFRIYSCQRLNSLPSLPYLATGPTLLAHNTCKQTLKQVLQSDPFSGRYWWLLSEPKLYEKGLYQFILSTACSPFFVKAQPMWLPAMVKVKQRQPTHVLSIGALPLGFWLGDYKTTWTAVLTQHDPFGLPSAFQMPLSRRLKQEKLHQQEPQLVQCIQHMSRWSWVRHKQTNEADIKMGGEIMMILVVEVW